MPIKFDFLAANKNYYTNTFPHSYLQDGTPFSALPLAGTTPKLIITCYDSRVVPEIFFGMDAGNTLVYRNAGARAATDTGVLKAVLISQFFTKIDEIMLVAHTGCGSHHSITDDIMLENIKQQSLKPDSPWKPGVVEEFASLGPIGFVPVPTKHGEDGTAVLNDTLKTDLEFLRNSKFVQKHVIISGWIYDVKTGVVTKTDF